MANSPELKLNITTNAEQIKAASSRIEQLTNALKIVELRARQGKISAEQYSKALSGITNEANKLNVSLKQSAGLQQTFFQSQKRVENGFSTMSGSLRSIIQNQNGAARGFSSLSNSMHDITQASNRSQQAFMSLAYIIQDMPYGIRGVANNITQLSQVLGTPIGINIAISALTSLAVVLSNVKDTSREANEAVSDFFGKFKKEDIGNLTRFRERVKGDISDAEKTILRLSLGIAPTTESMGTPDVTKTAYTKEYVDARTKQLKTEIAINQEIVSGLDSRIEKQKQLNALLDKYGIFIPSEDSKRSGGVRGGSYSDFADTVVGSENWKRKFDRSLDDKIAKGFRKKERLVPSIVRQEEDYAQLKEAVNTYNTVFFDPLRAGFKAIGDEIRTSLFGSLDAMREKFGNVAAAILDSLSRVIAKLIETAIAASLLSFLFPGAGGFGTMFKNLIMPGQLVTPTDSITSGNNYIPGRGQQQTVRVIGESVVSGDNILIVYKNAEYKRSVSRI